MCNMSFLEIKLVLYFMFVLGYIIGVAVTSIYHNRKANQ